MQIVLATWSGKHLLIVTRGPTRFQITYALAEISFQNTKSVFKAQNQFSKHKISFQNANPVLKTQITTQIHKISF